MKNLALFIFIAIGYVASSQVIYNTTRTVTSQNYTQDVHIKGGATVKFTGTFKFAKNVRVYVDDNSHIILEYASFERLNPSDKWFGIEMEGYSIKPCDKYNSTAVLLYSTVKGSIWGIVNAKVGSGREVGALVHIENCTFENQRNVTLYNEVINCGLKARIIGSTFLLGREIGDIGPSITLLNTKKIIKNNNFENLNSVQRAQEAIRCENSVGEILDNNIGISNPNTTHDGITIYDVANFYKEGISYHLPTLTVKGNTFIKTHINALRVWSISPNKFLYIEENNFLTGNDVNFIGSCSKGGFAYNTITNSKVNIENIGGGSYGFYGNKLDRTDVFVKGTVSANIGSIKVGQQFICNEFIGTSYLDVFSTSTGLPDQGFALNSSLYSNKNIFSTAPFLNINNRKLPAFKYYYYDIGICSNVLFPCSVTGANKVFISRPSEDRCIALGSQIFSLAPPSDQTIDINQRSSLLAANIRFNQKISKLKSDFIDPCYYENIKDNYDRILFNPSDYVDANIQIEYVDNKLNFYKNLSASHELVSHKDLFLSTYMRIKVDIQNEVEKDFYTRLDYDSTISNDSIKKIYRTIPSSFSEFRIANVLIKRNQFEDAISILNNRKVQYTLDSTDSLENKLFTDLAILSKELHNSNRDYKNMTLVEIDKLRDIAEYKNTYAGNSACVILGKTFGECSPENAIYNIESVTVAPEIVISPNPSNGMTLIQISNTANSDNTYGLKIYNSSGHLVFEQPLMGIELENIDLDISSWQNGNYFVSLIVNDVLFKSKILQKN